ncbi:MAG: glycosyltransferase family 4 protein [Planctomycetia bacterium]
MPGTSIGSSCWKVRRGEYQPRRRIAIVTGAPAPYREPVFAELAARANVDVKVFYCSPGHDDVAWSRPTGDGSLNGVDDDGVDREFLPNLTPAKNSRLPFVGYANPAVVSGLKKFQPSYVVVYGYNQLTHWLAFRWCKRAGVPFALRSDSNVHLDHGTSLQTRLRRCLVRRVVRRAAGVLAVGSANADYWRSYGATERQIFSAPYAVDNARVAAAAGARSVDADGLVRLLYVGRLIPRKRVDLLVEAFNRLSVDRPVSLTVVGDGPERAKLEGMQTESARRRTQWIGREPNDAALARYGAADLFVLPSQYEPWGLVVNEAMAGGLPVVAHRHCGAALDLVDDGRTGRLLDELSVDALTSTLAPLVDDPGTLKAMGVAARERVRRWSFAATVDGFLEAVDAARDVKPKSARVGLEQVA